MFKNRLVYFNPSGLSHCKNIMPYLNLIKCQIVMKTLYYQFIFNDLQLLKWLQFELIAIKHSISKQVEPIAQIDVF